MLTPPAAVFVEGGTGAGRGHAQARKEALWNERASDQQHDPYTQAKAQLTNQHRSALERVERDCDRPPDPVTEEAIQVGAKEIHSQATNPRPGLQERQVAAIRKARRKEIKERKYFKLIDTKTYSSGLVQLFYQTDKK
ncbi:hypothetical protein IIC45_02105 [Patescibacteria group bacterium]|nr:hypothetical protein [Patescibacteria group bacterium]